MLAFALESGFSFAFAVSVTATVATGGLAMATLLRLVFDRRLRAADRAWVHAQDRYLLALAGVLFAIDCAGWCGCGRLGTLVRVPLGFTLAAAGPLCLLTAAALGLHLFAAPPRTRARRGCALLAVLGLLGFGITTWSHSMIVGLP